VLANINTFNCKHFA